MSFKVNIVLREAHRDPYADHPYDLAMSASNPSVPGSPTHHMVALNAPFGSILPEIARFLDLNVTSDA